MPSLDSESQERGQITEFSDTNRARPEQGEKTSAVKSMHSSKAFITFNCCSWKIAIVALDCREATTLPTISHVSQ